MLSNIRPFLRRGSVSALIAVAAGTLFVGGSAAAAAPKPDPKPKPALPTPPRTGALGLDAYQYVESSFQVSANSPGSGNVYCPAGMVPFGGGEFNTSGSGAVVLTDSFPFGNSAGTGWMVYVRNNDPNTSHRVDVRATCGV